MNATWITLTVAIVIGMTKLLTYLLGDKRKIRKVKQEIEQKEKEYAKALARNDTVAISILDIELRQLRAELKSFTK